MSQGKRYKFNGSKFKVQVGYVADTPPQAVSGITNADPAVVSAVGSDLDPASVVKISGVLGMTQINDQLIVADNTATDEFDAANVNSSAYGTYLSGGTLQVVSFSEMCELTGMNQQDGAADQTEVSTICSTAKEFEQGLGDSGTLQLDFNYAPLESTQAALKAARKSGDAIAFEVLFPKSGGIAVMMGTVQQTSFQGQVNGVYTGSATIKLTGDVYILAGGA